MSLNRNSKAASVLFIALALTTSAAPSRSNDPVASPPKIEIIGGATHDWGSVAPGTVHTTILVTNTGIDTLVIKEIHQSCGCTTAPIDHTVIPRGDTARINVSIDMHASSGEQEKEVYVLSNDPNDSMATIALRANIIRDLTSTPTVFPSALKVPINLEYESIITLSNDGTDTLKLGQPYFEDAGLTARFVLDNDLLLPGDKTNLYAYVTPKSEGYHINTVVVPSNSHYIPKMHITMRCIAVGSNGKPTSASNADPVTTK